MGRMGSSYNERDNITMLVAALQDEFRRLRHDMHILVVDDNSPDGTGELVRALMREHPNLHLITGEKQGLGAIVTA
jgi:dolichol-phosphate mannosyltransferase